MARAEAEIDVGAPADRVFSALTDPKRGSEWNPSILEVSDLSRYPLAEGATWKQTMVMMGRPTTLSCRVARYLPPREGVLEVSGPYNATITTSVRANGPRSRVSQAIDYSLPGGKFGELAARGMRSTVERELMDTLSRLRDILEREARSDDGSRTQS